MTSTVRRPVTLDAAYWAIPVLIVVTAWVPVIAADSLINRKLLSGVKTTRKVEQTTRRATAVLSYAGCKFWGSRVPNL